MKLIEKIKEFFTGLDKTPPAEILPSNCPPELASKILKEPATFDATLLQELHEALAEDRRKQIVAIVIKDIDKQIWENFSSKKETLISFSFSYHKLNIDHWFGSSRILIEKYLKPEYEARKFRVGILDFSSAMSISWA